MGREATLIGFVRFAVEDDALDSVEKYGLHEVAAYLADERLLPAADCAAIDEVRRWFVNHLPALQDPSGAAVSWYRLSATRHIARAREIASILERNGKLVLEYQVSELGDVLEQDEFQVLSSQFTGPVVSRPNKVLQRTGE